MSKKMNEQKCIVCGVNIWWDDDPAPVACFNHSYGEVWKAAQHALAADGGESLLEDSPFETGIRRGAVVISPAAANT